MPVVPVRMTEAWLLVEEHAIRRASGNPNGEAPLALPDLGRLEDLSDPKVVLLGLLKDASGASGRRLRRFSEHDARNRVAGAMTDYGRLRALPAFRELEGALLGALEMIGARAQ